MRKLLILVLCTCTILAITIWGLRRIGQQTISPAIAQLHLLDCSLPCWIGIIPGSTTVSEAKSKLVAAYSGRSELQFKDSGFADGPVSANAVENAIEGSDFYLSVRLNISKLVDGKTETVQSIGLFETREDRRHYAPTVADILGAFGPPQWVAVENLINSGYEVTLRYNGLDVVFYSYTDHIDLTELPRLYLGDYKEQSSFTRYRRWKGFGSLVLSR